MNEELTVKKKQDLPRKICPLSNAGEIAIECEEDCPWWISNTFTDTYECAITRIARLMP